MTAIDVLKPPSVRPNDRRNVARLLIEGPDKPGIVAAVSHILAKHGANILSLDQHSTSPSGDGHFFQRTVFDLPHLEAARQQLAADLDAKVKKALGLRWSLHRASRRKRVALFASKADHCLLDLLWRQRRGELEMDVAMVISNHPDHAADVRQFSVPYFHIPVSGDKREAERAQLQLLKGNVDLVVLARYMQILSEEFIDEVGVPIINIHHSFLPAFIGAGPYQKAKERGVKLVGATAHYVTQDLDEGPIIEQDVMRVTHAESVAELARRGADIERLVLSRAVAWHCADRVIRHVNETVVLGS